MPNIVYSGVFSITAWNSILSVWIVQVQTKLGHLKHEKIAVALVMEKTHEQKANRAKQFESYLKASCRVPENKIPFFLHWVSQYHRFCESSA